MRETRGLPHSSFFLPIGTTVVRFPERDGVFLSRKAHSESASPGFARPCPRHHFPFFEADKKRPSSPSRTPCEDVSLFQEAKIVLLSPPENDHRRAPPFFACLGMCFLLSGKETHLEWPMDSRVPQIRTAPGFNLRIAIFRRMRRVFFLRRFPFPLDVGSPVLHGRSQNRA